MLRIFEKDQVHTPDVPMKDTSVDFLEGEALIMAVDGDGLAAAVSFGAAGITPGAIPYVVRLCVRATSTRSDVAATGKVTAAKPPFYGYTDMYHEPSTPYTPGMPIAFTYDTSQVLAAAGDSNDYGVILPAIDAQAVDTDYAYVYGIVIQPPVRAGDYLHFQLTDIPAKWYFA